MVVAPGGMTAPWLKAGLRTRPSGCRYRISMVEACQPAQTRHRARIDLTHVPHIARFVRDGWVSRLPGSDHEAARSDPGVSDLGVGGGGLFIGVRLGDRLDDQAGGKNRAEPPGEGPAGVGDGEWLMPVAQVGWRGGEAPGLGERALVEVP